jgi:hypothetical protein
MRIIYSLAKFAVFQSFCITRDLESRSKFHSKGERSIVTLEVLMSHNFPSKHLMQICGIHVGEIFIVWQ